MISKAPTLTDSGKAMLMRALAGETLTFTRIAIGSGQLAQGQDQESLTQLIHEELSITPASVYLPSPGSIRYAVTINGDFSSADIDDDFTWRELGVFAKIGDGNESLYAYANDGEDAGTMRRFSDNILTEQTLVIAVEIGDAENIGAIVNPHTQHAEAAVLDSHMSNKSNPHEVTKAQVGLGNVGNYAPGNAPITFTAISGTSVPTMASGETEGTLLGKAAKAASLLSSHLSAANPHGIGIGDIAIGGSYTGDGTQGRTVSLSFTPCILVLWNEFGQMYDTTKGVCGGVAMTGAGIRIPSGAAADSEAWNSSATALLIVENGFKVNQITGAAAAESIDTNESGVTYRYLAFRGNFVIEEEQEVEEVVTD